MTKTYQAFLKQSGALAYTGSLLDIAREHLGLSGETLTEVGGDDRIVADLVVYEVDLDKAHFVRTVSDLPEGSVHIAHFKSVERDVLDDLKFA